MLDVILFPDVYRVAKSLFDKTIPIFVTGVIEFDASRGEPFLRAEKVEPLQGASRRV